MMNDEQCSPKIIAFHLPQFHCIPENDAWWGKGFTEWTNTAKATPLFPGHRQPRTPLNENFYDLTNVESLIYQNRLAREYGIYGFCYYHYWFKGKLLLEKPLEILRDCIDSSNKIPYCLCWANESWTRTWTGSKEYLLVQEYGGQDEWRRHFEYLVEYFKDEKYIKIDNKPMLILYRSKNIPRCDEMIDFWDDLSKGSGFDGLHVVEEYNCFQDRSYTTRSAASLEFEPLYTMEFEEEWKRKWMETSDAFNVNHHTEKQVYNYDDLWNLVINRPHENSLKMCYLGAFVDWDNTARKGKYGRVVLGATPQKFEKYMTKQFEKASKMRCPFVFINAWNEWGEGTYLEPDSDFGFANLEVIKRITEKYR